MGKPKALKDQIPKVAARTTRSALSHKKFDDNEDIGDDDIEEESVEEKSSKRTGKLNNTDNIEDEDEAPEEMTKEESMSLYNLKQLHEQSILDSSSKKKLKKEEAKKKLLAKEEVILKPDASIDMNILEDLAKKKEIVDSDDDYDYDYMNENDDTVEELSSNIYGGTRKIGKISVQVLSGSVDVDGDTSAQKQSILNSDIFEHFKMSESASEFSKQLITGNNRIKYSTLKSQKRKRSRR